MGPSQEDQDARDAAGQAAPAGSPEPDEAAPLDTDPEPPEDGGPRD